jgi:drug/metabolite transporter (DMT)-like permease
MTRRGALAFAGGCIFWGIPFLMIKVAVEDGVSPIFVAWSRVALAAAILVPLAARSGALRTLRGRWRWLWLYGAIEIAAPFTLIAYGERHISSSLTAIILSATPLIVALLALWFDPEERASGRRLVGLLVGLAGVMVLLGIDVSGRPDEILGAAFVLLAAVGYASSPMLLKHRMSDMDLVAAMGVSCVLVTALLAPFGIAGAPTELPSHGAIASLVLLGTLCTAAALITVGILIAEIGPARAMVISYVNPLVAVALGVLILGEGLGSGAIAGLAMILGGSWIATDGRLPGGITPRTVRARSRTRRTATPPPAACVPDACAPAPAGRSPEPDQV